MTMEKINQSLLVGQRPDDVRTVAVGQFCKLTLPLSVKNSLQVLHVFVVSVSLIIFDGHEVVVDD